MSVRKTVRLDSKKRLTAPVELKKEDQLNQAAAIEQFVMRNRAAVLSTVSKRGEPRGTPITYLYEDREIFFITHDKSEKLKNLREDGRASVTIMHDGERQEGVQLFGRVSHIDEATPQMLLPFVSLMWNTAPFLPNFMKIQDGKLMLVRIRIRSAQYFYAIADPSNTTFTKVKFS